MLGALAAGGLADRSGRRPTLITAGVVFALGAIGSAAATSIPFLIAARFVVGLADRAQLGHRAALPLRGLRRATT